ncbi:DsrE family protein [Nitrospirillum pindoramense]|uniref:Uncharacterized protein n=1 Tax=Nitrospirillum amazonense TaxID=28077 RepID=A0A560GYL6_9PROT|nr:DsrE family protein [Nitrospirillum amazonense]TWB39127.1 hypothetical protein FBZ90_111124 [Nitrospirillum amazonense]
MRNFRSAAARFGLILLSLGLPAITTGCMQGQDRGEATGPYYTFQKVAYQNDGGWPDNKAYFQRLLHHIGNHIAATDGKVEIRVVNFAAGVQLFIMAQQDPDLARQLDLLRGKGVRFLICRNTLEGMKLSPSDLYGVKAEDVVPSGVAEVARLQGLGFVYLHP